MNAHANPPGTSFMEQHGATLQSSGFSVLPIGPREKKPMRWTGRSYVDMPWERYRARKHDAIMRTWAMWPDCGIGIVCGTIVAVDIDVDDPELQDQLYALAVEMLGETPAVRVGKEPRRLLVYRTTQTFKKMAVGKLKGAQVEILADGQQFVAYGIHPEGHPYRWVNKDLRDLTLADLPEHDHQGFWQFLVKARELLPQADEALPQDDGTPGGQHVSSGEQKGTVEAISSALSVIPNPDLSWDDWNRIGMAVFGALGDEGWDLFNGWSELSVKYNALETRRRWASYHKSPPTSIGAGTIYHIAGEYGWACPPGVTMNGEVARLEVEQPVHLGGINAPRTPRAAPQPAAGGQEIVSVIPNPGSLSEPVLGNLKRTPPKPKPTAREIPVIDPTTLEGRPVPEREWVVKGIIPKGQVTILSGDGGTGKSLLSLQLCVAGTTGGYWCGELVYAANTIYLGAEDDQDEMHRRLADIVKAESQSFGSLHGMRIVPLFGESAILAAPDRAGHMIETPLMAALREFLGEFQPDLVVLDTSANLFGGNENDKSQVMAFCSMLAGICRDFNCTILLLSHPSNEGLKSGSGKSGNVQWNNGVRSRLYLTRPDSDTDLRKLEVMKSNYGTKGVEFDLRYEAGRFKVVNIEKEVRETDERLPKLLRLIENGQTAKKPIKSINEVATALSLTYKAARSALDKARADKYITHEAGVYLIAPKGAKLLDKLN